MGGVCVGGGELLIFNTGHKEVNVRCTFVGNVCMSRRNWGLDVTCMSQCTCRSMFLGHWKDWYSSPMGVPLQNLQVRCSLGV